MMIGLRSQLEIAPLSPLPAKVGTKQKELGAYCTMMRLFSIHFSCCAYLDGPARHGFASLRTSSLSSPLRELVDRHSQLLESGADLAQNGLANPGVVYD